MLYPAFGYRLNQSDQSYVFDIHDRIAEYAKTHRVNKDAPSRGFLVERVIQEMYCDLFNVINLDDPELEFGTVLESNVDGLRELGPIYSRIREYRIMDIYEHYHLSLTEFMDLPKHIADFLVLERERNIIANSKQLQDAEDKAKKALKKEGFNMTA